MAPGTRVRFPYDADRPGPLLAGEVVQEWAGLWVIVFPTPRGPGVAVLSPERLEVVGPPLQASFDFEEAA